MSRSIHERVDKTRNLIAFFLIGSFVGALVAFTFKDMPSNNKDILTYMVGQLSGMAMAVLGYYFTKGVGQDSLDAEKASNTGKMADAVIAAATGQVPSNQNAASAATQVADAAVEEADRISNG